MPYKVTARVILFTNRPLKRRFELWVNDCELWLAKQKAFEHVQADTLTTEDCVPTFRRGAAPIWTGHRCIARG
jgi:hypothetical protein